MMCTGTILWRNDDDIILSKLAQAVMLMNYNRQVPGLNLGRDIAFLTQVLQTNSEYYTIRLEARRFLLNTNSPFPMIRTISTIIIWDILRVLNNNNNNNNNSRNRAQSRKLLPVIICLWSLRLLCYWKQQTDATIPTTISFQPFSGHFFSNGSTAPWGPRPPHFWGFTITFLDTPHSVGLLWTRDQLVAETSTWQHTTLTTDRHPCSWRDSNPQS
jgi:hypothetical protein